MHLKYLIACLVLFLYETVYAINNQFCFSLCPKNSCDGTTQSSCNGCRTGFMKDPTAAGGTFQCVTTTATNFTNSAKYAPVGASDDVTIDLKSNTTVEVLTVSGTSATCIKDSTYSYNYYSAPNTGTTITVNHPGIADAIAFYKVMITYGVIDIDQMDKCKLNMTFLTNTSSLPAQHSVGQSNGMDVSFQVCAGWGGSKNQRYSVFQDQFWWNSTDPLDFQAAIIGNTKTNPWGLMYVIIQVRLCHPYCLSCYGDSNTVCKSCDFDIYFARLSGTTCALTCALYYGNDTANPSVCIKCQANCTSCLDSATNCTACKTGYYLYDNGTAINCVLSCPTHYFPNNTVVPKYCQQCNSTCQNCTTNENKCTSCYPGLSLYMFACYNPCPPATFNDTTLLKCVDCSSLCTVCSGPSTNCSVCNTIAPNAAYLLGNTTCTKQCGPGFFQDSNNGTGPNVCTLCNENCTTCNFNATFCQSCAPTYYLFDNFCNVTCPLPDYFPDNSTWTCLDCANYCVKMNMKVYFKNSLKGSMICDLTFVQGLSWGPTQIQNFITITQDDPLLTISSFDITYQAVTPKIMRITITPKGYIFIYNVTFTFTTISYTGVQYYSANYYPFHQSVYSTSGKLTWFLIKAPSLSDMETSIIDGVSTLSDSILSFTTLPYVQQIKKTGIFAMLLSGAQATSTACLVNTIPAQNFYEGVRLWASFVYFDVPNWEQNSKKTKYVFVPPVQDLVKDARMLDQQIQQTSKQNIRGLFDTQTIDWRFQRTGQTSFFIFDMYINIFLIILCWILVIVGNRCIKNKIQHKRLMGMFYSFTLKVHEITIFYISLSTLLEWIYFDAASLERWVSLGLCLLFNAYFFFFELYIYHDMINYPSAQIGNEKYEYYCLRYGSLLKNIRFVEYDPKEEWSVKHWFRPYNYHILSYYKKFLMMISLPIFYKTQNAQIYVLMGIQLFEIVRFIAVWPFQTKLRNFIRLGLQFCLLFFFGSILIQSYMLLQIMLSDTATLQSSINIFYKMGWAGFILVFLFNIGHLCMLIYDTVVGCKKTNYEMMSQARKFYYMQRLNTYEQENEDVPLALINKWVKLGNLNDRKYDELPDINLRVEYFKILKTSKGYQVDMKKLFEIFMNVQFNYSKQNNISAGKKLNKRFSLTRSLSPAFFDIIDDLYNKYITQMDFEYLTIKTFQKVIQSDFKPGDKIELKPRQMEQKIQLETYAGQIKTYKLDKLLNGFPISYQDLKVLI